MLEINKGIKMTVYVTQQPRPNARNWVPNLEPATQYGELKYVFSGDEAVYCNPVSMMQECWDRLKDFDPDEDYILWPNTGDPAACWAVIMTIMSYGLDKIQFLYWDRKMDEDGRRTNEGFYTPVILKLV